MFYLQGCVKRQRCQGQLEISLQGAAERSWGHSFLGGWVGGTRRLCSPFLIKFFSRAGEDNGRRIKPTKKEIAGSNKFSHNGLKNKTLPKQVQPKVCARKPYGWWECVGEPVRGAECPLLPGRGAPHCQHHIPSQGSLGGAAVCAHTSVCACVRACMCVHACACSAEAAGEWVCIRVCRCAGGGVFLYSGAH